MNCPNCNTELDYECADEIDTFFCLVCDFGLEVPCALLEYAYGFKAKEKSTDRN